MNRRLVSLLTSLSGSPADSINALLQMYDPYTFKGAANPIGSYRAAVLDSMVACVMTSPSKNFVMFSNVASPSKNLVSFVFVGTGFLAIFSCVYKSGI